MPDFVTLTCPSCGGKLQITDDIDRFACAHCGTEHIVQRGGGIVALAPVIAGLAKVQSGVERTASELAIPRLTIEIKELETKLREIGAYRTKAAINGTVIIALGLVGLLLIVSRFSHVESPLRPLAAVLLLFPLLITLYGVALITRLGPNLQRVQTLKALQEKRAELKRHQHIVGQ